MLRIESNDEGLACSANAWFPAISNVLPHRKVRRRIVCKFPNWIIFLNVECGSKSWRMSFKHLFSLDRLRSRFHKFYGIAHIATLLGYRSSCRHKPGRSVLSVFLAYRRRVRSRILIRRRSLDLAHQPHCWFLFGFVCFAFQRYLRSHWVSAWHCRPSIDKEWFRSITAFYHRNRGCWWGKCSIPAWPIPILSSGVGQKETHCEVWSHQSGRILLVMVFCDGGSNDRLEN